MQQINKAERFKSYDIEEFLLKW